MAPGKAKKAAAVKQVRGQQGLGSFFGGSRSPASASNAAPSEATSEEQKAPIPEAATTASTPIVETPKQEESKPVSEPPAPAPTVSAPESADTSKAPTSATSTSGGLTEAQKQRIEENRRKALERKQQQNKKSDGSVGNSMPAVAANSQSSATSAVNSQSSVTSGSAVSKSMPAVANKSKSSATSGKTKKVTDDDHVTPSKRISTEEKESTPEKGPTPKIRRLQLSPSERSEDMFRTFGRVSWMQYNSLYEIRLAKLRAAVQAQALSLWSSEVGSSNVLTHVTAGSADSSVDVVAIGILFKDLKGRDNVIEKYQSSQLCTTMSEDFMDRQEKFCTDGDVLWLEDSISRIELEIPIDKIAMLSTGFVVAVRGCPTIKGKFLVKSMCFPASTVPAPLPAIGETGQYVAFLSGLFIGSPDEDVESRNRIVDFFLGKAATESSQRLAKAVQRLIVCGGTFGSSGKPGDVPPGLSDADNFFAQISENLHVDVLPGHQDPSNLSMPQMPMHPYFFRSAQKSSNFKSVSNPYQCNMDDLHVLGHSGQPVNNLIRCTFIDKPLEALTQCLDARLLAPTAPDTLGTQPFADVDPFVIEKVPQILFSGGHDRLDFEWRVAASANSGTLCICIPAFSKQPAVVLVNSRDPRDVRVHELGAETMSTGS